MDPDGLFPKLKKLNITLYEGPVILMNILLGVLVSHTLGSKVMVMLNGESGSKGVGVPVDKVGTLVGRVPGDKQQGGRMHQVWECTAH